MREGLGTRLQSVAVALDQTRVKSQGSNHKLLINGSMNIIVVLINGSVARALWRGLIFSSEYSSV